MGLIVDFVPNHMGIGSDNAWWLDVLEWGQDSPFAHYFDINWHPPRADLEGRVLLPVLGDQYGVILEQGEIALRFDPAEGSFSAWYFDHRFPISPRSYAAILAAGGDAAGRARPRFRRDRQAARVRRRASARRELKRALWPNAPRAPDLAEAIDRRCGSSPARPASRRALRRCTGCSKRNPIASPTGGSPARRSTTAAFSTSTTSPACAWSCPSCSTRPIA